MTGDFDAGQVAELTLTFDSGDTVTMDVPIVFACNAYDGLDPSQQEPEQSESPTTEPSPGDVPTDGTTVSPTESPSEDESPSAAAPAEPYGCPARLSLCPTPSSCSATARAPGTPRTSSPAGSTYPSATRAAPRPSAAASS